MFAAEEMTASLRRTEVNTSLMRTEDALFVAGVTLCAIVAATSLCAPLVVALQLSGDFVVACKTDVLKFVQFWDEHTIPRRVFAVFLCIEMWVTRGVAAREVYHCLQLVALKTNRGCNYALALYYLWTTVSFTLLLDMMVLLWAFLNPLTCDDILATAARNIANGTDHSPKVHTLYPLCVQSSDIADVVLYLHIFNAVLLVTLSGVVTALVMHVKRQTVDEQQSTKKQ